MAKIALGAGHGINTPGKRCMKKLDPNETREWQLNDRICRYMEEYLWEYEDVETLRVDDPSGKVDVSRRKRCEKANNWGADMLFSEHHNAGANGTNAGGIVIYRYPNSSKFTKDMQIDLYNRLINHTGLKGNRATPLREKKFDMVTFTNMAAVLVENGFMDSRIDVPIILSDEFAKKSAKAQVEFIVNHFNLKKKEIKDKGYLQEGDEGAAVKLLQQDLISFGYHLKANGIYGENTKGAVIQFQRDYNLMVDGYAGPQTLGKIEELKKAQENPTYRVFVDGKKIAALQETDNILRQVDKNLSKAKEIKIVRV